MPVDTAKVEGRRTLHFNTLDDIAADIERLSQGKVRALGNWSPGQILGTHLAGELARRDHDAAHGEQARRLNERHGGRLHPFRADLQ